MRLFLVITVLFLSLNHFAKAQQNEEGGIVVSEQPVSGGFALLNKGKAATIYTDEADAEVVHIAANALKNDVKLVSGIGPAVVASSKVVSPLSVLIGTIGKSKLIDQLVLNKKITIAEVKNKWETFSISVVENPLPGVKQTLVIVGSDPRGTAFGVFELSELIGVSPWYWWADVHPVLKKNIFIKGTVVSESPSVKYRGIFLNDEDWGLQPWAAKTLEPETGDIGPKTYARIFELLLRLKANLIWPAMHPSTKAFYHYPGNEKIAVDYAIVVGSSHAEPMLRNNVGEWQKTMGDFNYLSNRDRVYNYWETRVKESKNNDAIYTVGMRGVHDGAIEGVKTVKEAIPLLETIIEDQRKLLQKYINPNVKKVPQVFTVYKEVLDIYDGGIKLPEDITLVWPDDNYGYIQRLNNEKENERAGGSGVYYHASYWGRPHDYLWLSTTHPGLIREEMMKAYQTKSNRLWVLNIGDIKPGEYNMQLFLDMAYKVGPFKDSNYSKTHLQQWIVNIFGDKKATEITDILWQYYQLAFERKPEFMGWSQTEPTTKTNYTDYNHFYYGDEAQRRIDHYEQLTERVKALRAEISGKDADAFYQLVYYPVVGASLMNKKFLYRDKAMLYARQNRASAADYALLVKKAYDDIVKETQYYNIELSDGKWKNMMSMIPRNLPVYQAPDIPGIKIDQSGIWSIAPEGFVSKDSSLVTKPDAGFVLPAFNRLSNKSYFIDVFLSTDKTLNWTTKTEPWIRLSQSSGTLKPEPGKREQRIWVSIDWDKAKKENGNISFSANGKELNVTVNVRSANDYLSVPASKFNRINNKNGQTWSLINDLGYTGQSLMALPLEGVKIPDLQNTTTLKENNACVEYDFNTSTASNPEISIYTLPSHPINNNYRMRYAVSIDNGPLNMLDFKTQGRSEEWKQNVLRNSAIRKINIQNLKPGKHTLHIYMIDPGVILDRIFINFGNIKNGYSY
ncbi:MAG: glycosyl hydrolase 115 family protein [Candidatus Pedobacter colombiensis]|uniref:Glycosyl hydrolase 115 family protein n=1 Tax=Candidatus Pedobacter colombiensis TaxID=3121371 RepID=A0AAJ5W8T4_9SPHI|nr:glycosyl hydrolase 115 family protein [Pedobacter sp.]WEK20181.1 MAG: glycosyl hydrolase 115 family protein [Pedobacter sp.]